MREAARLRLITLLAREVLAEVTSRIAVVGLTLIASILMLGLQPSGVSAGRRNPIRDTVVVVVRDKLTAAPVRCFDLAAVRPRAIGGPPWRSWGGFIQDSTGTTRVGGVSGGTVQITISRSGYLDEGIFLWPEPPRPEALRFLLRRGLDPIPSCKRIVHNRESPSPD